MGKKQRRPRMQYWHGGRAGLTPGLLLQPGAAFAANRLQLALFPQELTDGYGAEFVHFTVDRDLAFDFAVLTAQAEGAGALYLVRPIGAPKHDPDFPPGVSFRASGALILEVADDGITATTPETHTAQRYQTWSDGSPIYGEDGAVHASPEMRRQAIRDEHLVDLAPWTDVHVLLRHAQELIEVRSKRPSPLR